MGIIISDTDSKYCISLGFITLLFAVINPSEAEAYPKLAIQLDLRVFVCLVVCVGPLCVVPRGAERLFFFFAHTHALIQYRPLLTPFNKRTASFT